MSLEHTSVDEVQETSCAEVRQPAGDAVRQASGATPLPRPTGGSPNRTILLLDAIPFHRLLVARLLAQCSCAVQTADTAADFVEAFRAHPFSLVLIDCDSPEIDGFAAAAALGGLPGREHTTVVALTDHVSQSDRNRRKAAGFDNYLEKAPRLDKVRTLLARYLPGAAQPAQQAAFTSLDPARLSDLAELARSSPLDLPPLFQSFFTTAARTLEQMRRAREEGHAESLLHLSAALKTASSAMGARRMEDICGVIHGLAASQALAGVEALMAELSVAWERAGTDLRAAQIQILESSGDAAAPKPLARSAAGPVLLAEHEPLVARFLSASLTAAGLDVTRAADGAQALALARDNRFQACLLDGALPGIDGYRLLSRFRADTALASLPVMILSPRNQEQEMLRAFDLGADDFVAQPLNPFEVVARTRCLLRRA